MKLLALIVTMLCLLCEYNLADMVLKRDEHALQRSTSPLPSSLNAAPTPITTALPSNHPVALYVPQVDPTQAAKSVNVEYYGPGNGGSTVYQIVVPDQATPANVVTATLIEDATNAELIGGQRVMTIGGQATSVYAAASCGFADGLKKDQKTKAAGYCVYWNVVDHATTTWTSVATQISAQTTIVPTARSKEGERTPIDTTVHLDKETSSALRQSSAALIPMAFSLLFTIFFVNAMAP